MQICWPLGLDGEIGAALDADEIGIVAARRELVGEVQADARRGGVGFDRVVDDAEAVLGEHVVVGRAACRVVDQREAGAIGA